MLSANATDGDKAKAFIRTTIKSRKDYRGSGTPVLFTTEDMLTDCLLLEDGNGRVIYETVDKLKTALRVSDIVTAPVMENLTREGTGTDAGFNFGLLNSSTAESTKLFQVTVGDDGVLIATEVVVAG